MKFLSEQFMFSSWWLFYSLQSPCTISHQLISKICVARGWSYIGANGQLMRMDMTLDELRKGTRETRQRVGPCAYRKQDNLWLPINQVHFITSPYCIIFIFCSPLLFCPFLFFSSLLFLFFCAVLCYIYFTPLHVTFRLPYQSMSRHHFLYVKWLFQMLHTFGLRVSG